MPDKIAPQLATLVEAPPKGAGWTYQIKLGGYRGLARTEDGDVRLFTRNATDWTAKMPRMKRRHFLVIVAGAAMVMARAVCAQKPTIPAVGFLNPASAADWGPRVTAFGRGLPGAGYTEGKNVTIEFRWAEHRYDRLQAMALSLVQREVRLLLRLAAVSRS